MLFVSIGCPAGVGPEVSVAAADTVRRVPRVLVGDEATILAAAELRRIPRSRFARYDGGSSTKKIYVHDAGPKLAPSDRKPGAPSKKAGAAQLAWVGQAFDLAHGRRGGALVTGPVSKWAIARSGARGAPKFRGHTEWLQARDGADASVMCFASKALVTSLVTTHLPVKNVPRALSPESVRDATFWLAKLLHKLGNTKPRIAIASLNPHAGESELLGAEEARAIGPGITLARRKLRAGAVLEGPVGAETAYRRAVSGHYDGVVAMYHDQATIPMKIVAFGDAVNVTMGLGVVRTSVDHGTAYDIAWTGRADAEGMVCAMKLAARLARN